MAFTEVEVAGDKERVAFTFDADKSIAISHMSDCCETVIVYDIIGDIQNLVGSPILDADETTDSDNWPGDVSQPEYLDSYTWTVYRLRTAKGEVTLRWLGESNGYYSEIPYIGYS
jgi:hypothetical protein